MSKKEQSKQKVVPEKKSTAKTKPATEKKQVKKQKEVKKETDKNGLIATLFFIIAVLSIALIVKIVNPNKVETNVVMYNNYHDNLIHVENQTTAKVQTNVFGDGKNLGVLLESVEEKNMITTISYKIIDEHDQEFSSETTTIALLGETKNGYCFTLPELNGEILKSITIEITQQEFDEGKAYNVEAFTSHANKSVSDDKITEITTNWRYNGSQEISKVSGLVLATKNDKIAGMGFFQADMENQEFTTSAIFGNHLKNNQLAEFEYDKLEMLVTYYE